jgi:hypothetical protein
MPSLGRVVITRESSGVSVMSMGFRGEFTFGQGSGLNTGAAGWHLGSKIVVLAKNDGGDGLVVGGSGNGGGVLVEGIADQQRKRGRKRVIEGKSAKRSLVRAVEREMVNEPFCFTRADKGTALTFSGKAK